MSEKGRMIVQEKTKVKCRIYPRNREFQIIPVIMRLFHCFYVVLIRGFYRLSLRWKARLAIFLQYFPCDVYCQ